MAVIFGIFTTFLGSEETTIATIPIVGQYLSDILTTAVGYFNSFVVTFPYIVIDWQIFIYVIIPFELGLLVAKVLLGSRVPAHNSTP